MIDVQDDVAVKEPAGPLRQPGDDAGQEYPLDVVLNTGLYGRVVLRSTGHHAGSGGEVVMLGGDHYGMYSERLVVVAVLYGVLGLGVRTEIGHQLRLLTARRILASSIRVMCASVRGRGMYSSVSLQA